MRNKKFHAHLLHEHRNSEGNARRITMTKILRGAFKALVGSGTAVFSFWGQEVSLERHTLLILVATANFTKAAVRQCLKLTLRNWLKNWKRSSPSIYLKLMGNTLQTKMPSLKMVMRTNLKIFAQLQQLSMILQIDHVQCSLLDSEGVGV